jgi:hypothetical protein
VAGGQLLAVGTQEEVANKKISNNKIFKRKAEIKTIKKPFSNLKMAFINHNISIFGHFSKIQFHFCYNKLIFCLGWFFFTQSGRRLFLKIQYTIQN